MTARAGYHVRMLTYSETKTVHGSVLDWTLLRISKFAFMWFLMFPEKKNTLKLSYHILV
jgi:hypothetical protein